MAAGSGLVGLHEVTHEHMSTAVMAHQYPGKLLGMADGQGQLGGMLWQSTP